MLSTEDIKKMIGWIIIIVLFHVGGNLVSTNGPAEIDQQWMEIVDELQNQRDSSMAIANREHELRINQKLQYENQKKLIQEFADAVDAALHDHDVDKLDSLATNLERAIRHRENR